MLGPMVATAVEDVRTTPTPGRITAAALVSLSALFLFGLRIAVRDHLDAIPNWTPLVIGYVLLAAGLLLASRIDRELLKDLGLIGVGITIVSTTSVEADVSWPAFFRIGTVLVLAVLTPVVIDRLIFKRKAIRFPWLSGKKWSPLEKAYLFIVPFLGWLILPAYFITSGTYQNWPHITDTSELVRFFIGVNFVGTWDELFFICTCFALLRRHFPVWLANLLQATIFVSFLWELGYRSWGPFLTAPFALLQGWLFSRTHSLLYVLIVHLLFDVVVFLSIVHAHNPAMFNIFLVSP